MERIEGSNHESIPSYRPQDEDVDSGNRSARIEDFDRRSRDLLDPEIDNERTLVEKIDIEEIREVQKRPYTDDGRQLIGLAFVLAGIALLVVYSSQAALIVGSLALIAFGVFAIVREVAFRDFGGRDIIRNQDDELDLANRSNEEIEGKRDSEIAAMLMAIPLAIIPFFALIYFMFR